MQKGQVQIILIGILVLAVVAAGAYYLGRQTTPKPSLAPVITSQTPQPSPSPTDETANWKTYTFKNPNIPYNYVISHPSEALVNEEIKGYSGKTILNINGGTMEILVNLDVQGEVDPVKSESINVAGNETTKFYMNDTTVIIKAVPFPDAKNTVLFQFNLPKDTQKAKELESVFDQILSTFKFIN
ncbi:hypothetical protein HYS96_01145 [Candidatus Daviesbacteria bacterium]|nr:hypothetical protein [Candidatus Daviesbacteria bacterium]